MSISLNYHNYFNPIFPTLKPFIGVILVETFAEIFTKLIGVATFLKLWNRCKVKDSKKIAITRNWYLPNLPNSSTPRAAKMKKRRKKRRPRLPTWGRACMTVSRRARIPLAIFSSFNTRAILKTLITLMIVGLMGNTWPWISSRAIPIMDKNTIDTSSWFHLSKNNLN